MPLDEVLGMRDCYCISTTVEKGIEPTPALLVGRGMAWLIEDALEPIDRAIRGAIERKKTNVP